MRQEAGEDQGVVGSEREGEKRAKEGRQGGLAIKDQDAEGHPRTRLDVYGGIDGVHRPSRQWSGR